MTGVFSPMYLAISPTFVLAPKREIQTALVKFSFTLRFGLGTTDRSLNCFCRFVVLGLRNKIYSMNFLAVCVLRELVHCCVMCLQKISMCQKLSVFDPNSIISVFSSFLIFLDSLLLATCYLPETTFMLISTAIWEPTIAY